MKGSLKRPKNVPLDAACGTAFLVVDQQSAIFDILQIPPAECPNLPASLSRRLRRVCCGLVAGILFEQPGLNHPAWRFERRH